MSSPTNKEEKSPTCAVICKKLPTGFFARVRVNWTNRAHDSNPSVSEQSIVQ
jgi:hypothetical protein